MTTEIEIETVEHCARCGADLTDDNQPQTYLTGWRPDRRVACDRCCETEHSLGTFVQVVGRDELAARRYTYQFADSGNYVLSFDADQYPTDAHGNHYEDAENIPEEPAQLLDYSANVLDHCEHAPIGTRLVFGVELEMETESGNEDIAQSFGDRGLRHILKADGSLDDGVELVTIPMTLAEHQTSMDWRGTLRPFIKRGCRSGSTSTCGIHVHINRAALDDLTVGKILVMLNSANPAMFAFVSNIAQRSPTSYCGRRPKTIDHGKARRSDKYDAVHLNGPTVELRIFKGNMRAERVLKNVEFAHALCQYLPTCAIADLENPAPFLAWLDENRKQYPNLCAYIDERNTTPAIAAPLSDAALGETEADEARAA